ncbi:N-alpha-acetyltransferase 35, NatC auxiliary subunit-like [Amphibalanus amphitrite]|uniref:N-alpha-acetyltransferase 35, NatC auxiliary subunit-like n=1 Tax=Amphibalanus amphitrite TaxID=1232801 RepID=UPI001C907B0A|nr:N-alpha-acetyltransferase 35, NatC auxiliary subunit-like [Amphibalanus amphitrite]XP_043223592.1 N-alpha-acetyltransferase 35, NatC auxiliary subunit-like [Amphibalanus amphitrite]
MDLAPSAPPEPTEVEYHWTDITDDFLNACKDLKLGELVHDDMFGLFDAMSAIEMMDPKMDVGMLCNSSQRQIRSFQQAVEDGLLKTADLTPREQLGVMDTSLAYLLSWLEGHSLTQTVSTNAYLQAPHSIQDRCVKAFSVATIQLVNTISELLVQVALLYEEEDFQPQSLPDRTGVTPLRAVGMLREAEEDVTRELRARRKAGDTAAREETEELVAVQARLKFFRCLFQAVLAFSKKENQGLEEAWKALTSAKELLPVLKNTCPMGASYEQVEQAAKGGHLVTMGFDPLLNQRQLPPAFPRYPRLRALPATMDELTALLDRLLRLRTVLECKHLHALMDYMQAFSATKPCVFSRTVLFVIAEPLHGLSSRPSPAGAQTLLQAARAFIAPPSLAPRSPVLGNEKAKDAVDMFMCRCQAAFYQLLQVAGHNRARQRQKLEMVLADLAGLQEEAERVDTLLHALCLQLEPARHHLVCFTTWILYHVLRVMIQYLLSGFELELYSAHEYHYIYWYLSECLYGWMVSTLNRADSFLAEHDAAMELAAQRVRNSKKSRAKKRKSRYERDIVLTQALQNLCGGLHKTCIGLQAEGRLQRPHAEFDNEQVRYEHRFWPFSAVVTPPPVQYGHYRHMTGAGPPQQNRAVMAYSEACQCFHQARGLLETLPANDAEVAVLTRMAKTNYVVARILAGGHSQGRSPIFDFSSHKYFPVIRIQ